MILTDKYPSHLINPTHHRRIGCHGAEEITRRTSKPPPSPGLLHRPPKITFFFIYVRERSMKRGLKNAWIIGMMDNFILGMHLKYSASSARKIIRIQVWGTSQKINKKKNMWGKKWPTIIIMHWWGEMFSFFIYFKVIRGRKKILISFYELMRYNKTKQTNKKGSGGGGENERGTK